MSTPTDATTTDAPDTTGDGGVRMKSLTTRWLTRNLTIRVLAYTAGGHLFAGFLYLLFAIGSRQGH